MRVSSGVDEDFRLAVGANESGGWWLTFLSFNKLTRSSLVDDAGRRRGLDEGGSGWDLLGRVGRWRAVWEEVE